MAGMSNTEYRLNREVAQKQIESEIRYYLKNETLTFGANDAVELEKVVFDWPDYWEQNQAPSFLVVCLLYTSPSPRDVEESRMPSSA